MCADYIRFLEENRDVGVALRVRERKEEQILITTYQDVIKNQSSMVPFDLIICDQAQFVKQGNYFALMIEKNTKFLGLLPDGESSAGWFSDAKCLFSYELRDVVKDGYHFYHDEQRFIQNFLKKLLEYQGYRNILEEVVIPDSDNMRADIVAQKGDNVVVMEVKSYRSLHNSKVILNNALKQVLKYKYFIEQNDSGRKVLFFVVLPCEVDEESQNEIYDRFHVITWDINNLIYLCEGNRELLNLLMSCTPYPSLELKAKKPLDIKGESRNIIKDKPETFLVGKYMQKLDNCKPGKLEKADKEYESICTEIIKYLFGTEFFRVSAQHHTEDEMFRMDLWRRTIGLSFR